MRPLGPNERRRKTAASPGHAPGLAPCALRITDLTVARGGAVLFASVDITLTPGQSLVVRGPNGSGKSSLLRVLAGLARPAAGAVTYTADHLDDPAEAVAYLGHGDGLSPGETPRRHLRFCAQWTGAAAGGLASAIAAMDLGALMDIPAKRLSAGQRRRAALARIIASNRPVWLLDEPAAPLDSAARERLVAAFADHRQRGGIIITALHEALALPGAATLDLTPVSL